MGGWGRNGQEGHAREAGRPVLGEERRSCTELPKSRPDRSQSLHSSEEAEQCPWSEGRQEGGDVPTMCEEAKPAVVPMRLTKPETYWADGLGRNRAHRRHGCWRQGMWYLLFRKPYQYPSTRVAVRPPTGEPDAGDLHVRFGGRGGRTQSALPTPIQHSRGRLCHSISCGELNDLAQQTVQRMNPAPTPHHTKCSTSTVTYSITATETP